MTPADTPSPQILVNTNDLPMTTPVTEGDTITQNQSMMHDIQPLTQIYHLDRVTRANSDPMDTENGDYHTGSDTLDTVEENTDFIRPADRKTRQSLTT
jgi:hypothetical protein